MASSKRSVRGKPSRGRAGDYVFEPGEGWVEEVVTAPGPETETVSAKATVIVGRETKGRKGAGVTVVHGLDLSDEALAGLAQELKQTCATGGNAPRQHD